MANIDNTSLWQKVAPNRGMSPALAGEAQADVGIIGGGFTGLSTALHLARKGVRVAVIEGAAVGNGGSGRNNGQVIPTLAGSEPAGLEAAYGAAGERLVALVRGSAEYLFRMAEAEGIDCEAEQTGWFQPAHTPAYLALSEARVKAWSARGAPCEVLDAAQGREMLGSDFWYGGMYNPTGGHINPLMLVRGLARACVAAGVVIYEKSTVKDVVRDGRRWKVSAGSGSLMCSKVLLATNAYSGELTGGLMPEVARSIMPVLTWQMATAPLDADLRTSIVPGRQAVSDTRGDLRYFRYDARGRLVAGGGLILPFAGRARVQKLVAARLVEAFPQLGTPPRFEHTWSGLVAVTPNHLPHFHELGPGFYSAIGYNGRGVALSISLGRELAQLLAGGKAQDLALPMSAPRAIPMHGLTRRVARTALLYYRLKDTQRPKI